MKVQNPDQVERVVFQIPSAAMSLEVAVAEAINIRDRLPEPWITLIYGGDIEVEINMRDTASTVLAALRKRGMPNPHSEADRENACERLRLAQRALEKLEYFGTAAIGPDIAPRITEYATAMKIHIEKTGWVLDEIRKLVNGPGDA